ncbi:MAG: CpaE-like family protein [Actinomycetota bacterium]|nr:CpaE-like family protein [Actinomycetota bacterium]
MTRPVRPARALLVTDNPVLLDDLLRLAAAASCEPEVAPDAASARAGWSRAPVVIVGADVVDALARAGLPRREGVVLVGGDLDDADIWRRGVLLGAQHVVFLPDAESWLVDRFADAAEGGQLAAPVVGVVGGRGGAGATVLASALAVTAARQGRRALLVDGDPLGGGIDLALGAESVAGLRWPQLTSTRGRVAAGSLAGALPQAESLSVLSWDRGDALTIPAEAMSALLSAAERGSELVVVDLPRAADAAARVALERASVVLLVVPAEVRASAAAARVAAGLTLHCPDLRVVVRGPAPSGLSASVVAESLGLPLAADLAAEPGIAAALERGEAPARRGRGPLATFSAAFLDGLLGAGSRRAA